MRHIQISLYNCQNNNDADGTEIIKNITCLDCIHKCIQCINEPGFLSFSDIRKVTDSLLIQADIIYKKNEFNKQFEEMIK
jgi:hypothetical protein